MIIIGRGKMIYISKKELKKITSFDALIELIKERSNKNKIKRSKNERRKKK